MTITDTQIDEAVLLTLGKGHWKKVAFVIASTWKTLTGEVPSDDETCDRVARRVNALVHRGHLEAQGNIQNWRRSEVRLPNHS
jgi:hypothetical protein